MQDYDAHHIKKRLGQNFLVNQGIVEKIVASGSIGGNTGVIEIGAGKGALTRELARHAGKVLAIELDRDLVSGLISEFGDSPNVTVVQGDILRLDLQALIGEHLDGSDIVVYGNLPYYITSSITMKLLESRLPFRSVVVMVQKEAAVRFTVEEGDRLMGAVTLAVRYFSEPHYLFTVSPGSFFPIPKVFSAVVRFDIRKEPPVHPNDEALMFRVIKVAFLQRRKIISNSIGFGLNLMKADILEVLDNAGIDPLQRAEKLTLRDYAEISDSLYKLMPEMRTRK